MRSVLYPHARRLASSRSGLILALAWGAAEALWWPIVPDFFVAATSPAAPSRWWKLALHASAGSVAGGAIGYFLGVPIESAPLVTPGMIDQAQVWLATGPWGILRQPLSGIPYKVFVFIARNDHLDFMTFMTASIVARSLRIFAAGAFGGLCGRIAGTHRFVRYYDLFLTGMTVVFAFGLWLVVKQFA